ncbi:hypothetical protein QTP88_004327 [Uroleucon formosanum]
MNLISMKSCIVLLIIVVSSVSDDIKWSDKPDVARLVKRIDQKLASFRQVVISSREALNVNDNCGKMSQYLAIFTSVLAGIYIIQYSFIYFSKVGEVNFPLTTKMDVVVLK